MFLIMLQRFGCIPGNFVVFQNLNSFGGWGWGEGWIAKWILNTVFGSVGNLILIIQQQTYYINLIDFVFYKRSFIWGLY